MPVTFSIKDGSGNFNGQPSLTVLSDSDGRAQAVLTLGPKEGIDTNLIEASFENNIAYPASFMASGFVAGAPEDTSVSGVVVANTDTRIEGVTISIPGTNLSAVTDANGQFKLEGAPVGHIFLDVDGRTAGNWPHLEFEMVNVSGIENTLGMPIFLIDLSNNSSVFVDETTGGSIELPEVPGFKLEVAPNSVTFPDGSRSGTIRVTAVHADRVPMTPNFGQQPRIVVTIQPPGAHFDPPARLSLPNVDGLLPGQITEMYSFDHDLGSFVSIGTGTVSEDGTVLTSDPGLGVVKAGWHCGGDPSPAGSGGHCPACNKCETDRCDADREQDGLPCNLPLSVDNLAFCFDGECIKCISSSPNSSRSVAAECSECVFDSQCDDGNSCNGVESCFQNKCVPSENPPPNGSEDQNSECKICVDGEPAPGPDCVICGQENDHFCWEGSCIIPQVDLEFRNSGNFSSDNDAPIISALGWTHLGFEDNTNSVDGKPSIINLVEIKGTILPSGFDCPVAYDFDRFLVTAEVFSNGQKITVNSIHMDDISNGDEDLSPSNDNHIYSVDGPGVKPKITLANGNPSYNKAKFTESLNCQIGPTRHSCATELKWCSVISAIQLNGKLIRDVSSTNIIEEGHSCF